MTTVRVRARREVGIDKPSPLMLTRNVVPVEALGLPACPSCSGEEVVPGGHFGEWVSCSECSPTNPNRAQRRKEARRGR